MRTLHQVRRSPQAAAPGASRPPAAAVTPSPFYTRRVVLPPCLLPRIPTRPHRMPQDRQWPCWCCASICVAPSPDAADRSTPKHGGVLTVPGYIRPEGILLGSIGSTPATSYTPTDATIYYVGRDRDYVGSWSTIDAERMRPRQASPRISRTRRRKRHRGIQASRRWRARIESERAFQVRRSAV